MQRAAKWALNEMFQTNSEKGKLLFLNDLYPLMIHGPEHLSQNIQARGCQKKDWRVKGLNFLEKLHLANEGFG